jgi:hypothetical protein
MVIATRLGLGQPRFVISRGTALTAIATFAMCAVACSSSSSPQVAVHDDPAGLPGDDTTVLPPIDPPFYVLPPITVALTVDAATSDSGDASATDAGTGVDAQVTDAALDGNAALDGDAGETGPDAPATDASPLELDAAADADR